MKKYEKLKAPWTTSHLVNTQNTKPYSCTKNVHCSNPRADNSTKGSSVFGSTICLDPVGQDQKVSVLLVHLVLHLHLYQETNNNTETVWVFHTESGNLPATSWKKPLPKTSQRTLMMVEFTKSCKNRWDVES